MPGRRLLASVCLLLLLAACGSAASDGPARAETTAPVVRVGAATVQRRAARPTRQASASPTEDMHATYTPVPQPTATEDPRSPTPSETPAPTKTLPPTEIPTPPPPTRTMLGVPPAEFLPIPPLRGTLYARRSGELIALDLATGAERATGIQVGPRIVDGRFVLNQFSVAPNNRLVAVLREGTLQVLRIADRDALLRVPNVASIRECWAPDSSALVFTRPGATAVEEEVWVAELPGGELRKIGAGTQPAWSPEGQRIAYVGPYSGPPEPSPNSLWLANRRGANQWSPLSVGGDNYADALPDPIMNLNRPFWSADGRAVLVFAYRSDGYVESTVSTLEQVDATTGARTTLRVLYDVYGQTLSPAHTMFALGPGGQSGLAFRRIYKLDGPVVECSIGWCAGTGLRETVPLLSAPDFIYEVAWSPDERHLAGLRYPDFDEAGEYRDDSFSGQDLADVRLVDQHTELISEPLLRDVDPWGGLEWRGR